MTDVSIVGAVLAGLVSFLSPCVLPLVPGYVSMLSGIGMEQLRQGQQPRAGLFASSVAFVLGFSSVFISFGASASTIGQFLRENRALLAPVAGALILMFGLHLLGWLAKLNPRGGTILGVLLVSLALVSALQGAPLFAGFRSIHFFSFALIGFFGPVMGRWLNRDVRLHNKSTQPGIWGGLGSPLRLAGRRVSAPSWRLCLRLPPEATPSHVGCCCSQRIPRDWQCHFCSRLSASASFSDSISGFAGISTPSKC